MERRVRVSPARSRSTGPVGTSVLIGMLVGLIGSAVHAQGVTFQVIVEQIAGSNIYISAGAGVGIAPNDTLLVFGDGDGDVLGSLQVLSTSTNRSVVVFAGDPFPLTRGTELRIALMTDHVRNSVSTPARRGEVEPPPGIITRQGPVVSGRLALEVGTSRTRTTWQSNVVEEVDRTFTTPSIALRAAVANLPGGLRLTTNVRGTYRYSSPDVVRPERSLRIYQVGIEKSGDLAQLKLGRFYSPFETYSGYWDGVLVRLGRERGFGAGVAAGFQPERSNEGFSSSLPKYTAFLDYQVGEGGVRYATDVSFHRVQPRDGSLFTHTFAGWSQRLRVEQVRIRSDLRVDRDPQSDNWTITRLHASGSVPLARSLSLHARYGINRPYFLLRTQDLLPFRRDHGSAGITLWGRSGALNAEVTANRFDGGPWTLTYSSSFNVIRTPLAGLGFSGSASLWTSTESKTLNVSGGMSRTMGGVEARATYLLYRTVYTSYTLLSHSADVSLALPLARHTYANIQARTQWGDNLNAVNLHAGLWTSF